jgi:HSP20 family molecular chaperone IbpA
MKTNQSLEKNEQLLKHRKNMKNISANHEIELEKVKVNNSKEVNLLRNSHQVQLNSIRNQHEQKLYKELNHNEEVLSKVKSNLNQVKKHTEQEKLQIEVSHSKEMQDRKKLHEANILKESELATFKVKDINHSGNVELQKIQRQIDSKKSELKHGQVEDQIALSTSHKSKMAIDKDIYRLKKANESDKFQRALLNQKKNNVATLAGEEKKQQIQLVNTKNLYDNKIKKVTEDGIKNNQAKRNYYEKESQRLFKTNEQTLKNIVGKKEKLIKGVQDSITEQYKLGLKKKDDNFYSFGKLQINVKNNLNNNGYIVEVPIAEHEASHVELRAESRELRFSMERKYQYEMQDNQSDNKVSRVESYNSKVPVENIVDPKTITKSYNDGILRFEIKFA